MVNGLLRRTHLGIYADRMTCVQVAIKARKIRGRHLQAQAVSRAENIAGHPHLNFVCVHLVWLEQGRLAESVAVTGADDAVAQVLGIACRRHVDQLGRPVCIERNGGGIEHQHDRSGHFQIRR